MQDIPNTADGGVSNLSVGNFIGDGTECLVTLGFQPRYVKVVNLTDRTVWEWIAGMPAAHTLKTVAAGTMTDDATSAIVAGGGQDGFRGFKFDNDANIATKAFHYIAFG